MLHIKRSGLQERDFTALGCRRQGAGGAGAQFYNSSVARQGDLGSKLPKGPAQARRSPLAYETLTAARLLCWRHERLRAFVAGSARVVGR